MSEFTRGPWQVTKRDNTSLGSVHYVIETVDKLPIHPWSTRLICWMSGTLGESLHNRRPEECRDDPETEADARLLSAAPEMYEALTLAYHHIGDAGVTFEEWDAARNAIRAALAKADGHRLT